MMDHMIVIKMLGIRICMRATIMVVVWAMMAAVVITKIQVVTIGMAVMSRMALVQEDGPVDDGDDNCDVCCNDGDNDDRGSTATMLRMAAVHDMSSLVKQLLPNATTEMTRSHYAHATANTLKSAMRRVRVHVGIPTRDGNEVFENFVMLAVAIATMMTVAMIAWVL